MELRPITADDLPVVHRLHRRAETFDNIPAVTSMDDLRSFIDGVQTTMATDTRLAEIGNAVVGYVHTFHLPSEVRLERCYVFGQVDPAHRRHGIGTELLRWGLERAENLLRSSGSSLPKFIRTDHYDFVDGPRQLFTSMGLKPVRFHDQMRRSLEVLPPAVELDGIAIVPWPAERNAEVREVKNVAFADHWGSTPTSPEFWEQMLSESTTRLDLSHIALTETGDVVGYCLNDRFPTDDELLGRKEGWIGNLGTHPDYRGRGIATALINRSLQSFAAEGLTHACLDVDSDSLTGARRLYETLGFVAQTSTITYELQVAS